MGGLGKGLGALLSDNSQSSVEETSRQKDLRKKQKELDELVDEIEVRKNEVNEVKKDLTIKLLLEGKVDKENLFKLEEELKYCFDRKEKLELEIERLARDITSSMEIPSIPREALSIDPSSDDAKAEIDLTMIRDIIFDEDNDPSKIKDEGPEDIGEAIELTDDEETAPSPSPGSRSEMEHLRNLKEELNGPSEAKRIEMESGKTGRGETSKTPASPAKPFVRRRMAPKKVRLVRKVKRGGPASRDKKYYGLLNEAQYYLMRNDPESAKGALLMALKDHPMDSVLLYHLGNAFFMEGDLDSAEKRYRKSAEVDPGSYRALNNLGIVLKKKGDREAAIEAFNQALEVNDSYDRGWLNLGSIFMEIEPPMLNEARIFLRRALECNPKLKPAREKLDRVMETLGQGS